MIYRITVDMMFNDPDPMGDILEEVQCHEHQAITINPGQPNEEKSIIDVVQCHHDETPTSPCHSIYHWESP